MLGSNVPTIGGLQTAFRFADEWGCECIQVYLTPSRRWSLQPINEVEEHGFRLAKRQSRVRVVVGHVPLLVNLASSDLNIRTKSLDRLVLEWSRADRLDVPYLVLHPGSSGDDGRTLGLIRIVEALNAAASQVAARRAKVLLETMAGQGNMLGHRFEELALILSQLESPKSFGICFDTAHAYAAGYDFTGYAGYERVLRTFDAVVGLSQIKVIHLNDSKSPLGSRVDRHAAIGEGQMGIQVFHSIVRAPEFADIPKIIEVPERDAKSRHVLEALKKLQAVELPIDEPRREFTQLTMAIAE